MKDFIVILREPDGRTDEHSEVETANHAQAWKQWWEKFAAEGKVTGGNGLTMHGRIVKGIDAEVEETIHYVGTEIVGGFLLIKADSIDEAASIIKSCPIYEFGGYAEVRELMS